MESAVALAQAKETEATAAVHLGLRLADAAAAAAGPSTQDAGRLVRKMVHIAVQTERVQRDLRSPVPGDFVWRRRRVGRGH